MEKQVVIIGAGVSGLIACKYALQKHLNPIVFEAEGVIGGVWAHTLESTKLQSSRVVYGFSDFPWPSHINELPRHDQVIEYLESYARHFGLYPYVQFNSRVVGIDYVGGESEEEMDSWDLWGGNGMPFGSKGKWHIEVQDTKSSITKEYHADFVILCIGQFSGLPNIPEFPPNQGPEVFNGKVLHSMDYSHMDNLSAKKLIKNKRVAVIGSSKAAVDIATECAHANGVEYPCTMITRTVHWYFPVDFGPNYGHLLFVRLIYLCYHQPGETFLRSILATCLSPMRWLMSKFVGSFLKCLFPLKKYDMVPKESVMRNLNSCQFAMLPEDFFDRLEERSVVVKNSSRLSFCQEGLLIEGESQPLQKDVVIFATGFKGDEKLRNIFKSPRFKHLLKGSPNTMVPLYRQIIHPRIPRLAVIGYAETFANLATSELRCQWLAQLLDKKFKLPTIWEMEHDIEIWVKNFKDATGKNFRRPCITTTMFWYNDQLCKDMGANPKRKNGVLANWFVPYVASDYAGLAAN